MTTLTLSGTAEVTLALDANVFSVSGGTLTIQETAFSSLGTATLSTGTEFLVVTSGTPGTTTMSALANELSGLINPPVPTITFSEISNQYIGYPFSVTGTLENYSSTPTFTYSEINPNGFVALPSGSTVTSSSFTFTNPAISTAGSYYVTFKDTTNKVLGISNTFTVTTLTLPEVGTTPAFLALDASVATNIFSNASGTTEQTTNGGVVEAWKDSIGGVLFTESTSANAPVLATSSQNSHSGIQFATDTGSNWQYLKSTSSAVLTKIYDALEASGTGLTVALVFKQVTLPTTNIVLAYFGNGSASFISLGIASGGNPYTYYNNSNIGFSSSYTPVANGLVAVIFSLAPGTTNGSSSIYVNSNSSTGNTYTGVMTQSLTEAIVGNCFQTSGFSEILLYELDIWQASASSADITNIQNYINAKWG